MVEAWCGVERRRCSCGDRIMRYVVRYGVAGPPPGVRDTPAFINMYARGNYTCRWAIDSNMHVNILRSMLRLSYWPPRTACIILMCDRSLRTCSSRIMRSIVYLRYPCKWYKHYGWLRNCP